VSIRLRVYAKLLGLSLLILAGCGRSDLERRAFGDFRQRYPVRNPTRIYVRERDARHAEVHIEYNGIPNGIPPTEVMFETVFVYVKQSNTWELIEERAGVAPRKF
jgi:hypothetical protein